MIDSVALQEACGIIARIRVQFAGLPIDPVWALLNNAEKHLREQLISGSRLRKNESGEWEVA